MRRSSFAWHRARAAFAALGLVLCLVSSMDLLGPGATTARADFAGPTEIRAARGVRRAMLRVAERKIDLAGRRILARVFGAFVGPTPRGRAIGSSSGWSIASRSRPTCISTGSTSRRKANPTTSFAR